MTPQEVFAIVRQVAQEQGFPHPELLVATVWQESGGRPTAVGDNGHSVGIFQEHDRGRGAGLSATQRQDVRGATLRAIREFSAVRRPGQSLGQWAAAAQRPLDSKGYATSIDRMLSGQDRAFSLGTAGGTAPSGNAPSGAATGATGAGSGAWSVAAGDAPDWLKQAWAAGSSVGRGTPSGGVGQAAGAVASRAGQALEAVQEVWPVAGQAWGRVNNPFGGQQARSAGATVALPSSNVGADLTATYGAPVLAPVSGTVVQAFDAPNETDRNLNSGWGGMVLVQGDNGYTYRLSHLQPGLSARAGQRVTAGQQVGRVGMSGNTTGPHLDAEKFSAPGKFVDIASGAGKALAQGVQGAAETLTETGPFRVSRQDAPDWLQQAWAAGSTVGKGVADTASRTAQTAASSVATAGGEAMSGAWKVAQDVAPDWLKQAWAAGSTVGR